MVFRSWRRSSFLIVGRMVAGLVRRGVGKLMNRGNVDPTVGGFVRNMSYILVMVFTVLAVLAKFGIQTASFVAVLGAAGFAVGFALQGSLANFAAGILILVLRPFKVGDFIDAGGVAGSVKEIRLFTTELATPDNVQILIPNGPNLRRRHQELRGQQHAPRRPGDLVSATTRPSKRRTSCSRKSSRPTTASCRIRRRSSPSPSSPTRV